ncbi:lectin-like domain-containing protein [Lacibacter sp. H407]|uniref:lectin-like domain-containing protein n=1 Tax=Lacibacter sp. H407 TaxID=3133423 RepID=UPI0030BB0CA9
MAINKLNFTIVAGLFMLLQHEVQAQQFSTHGNASQTGAYTYIITPNEFSQAGMATNLYPLDLTQNFTLNFLLNFGLNDATGADGFAFLMSNICNPQLTTGNGLGVKGIPNSLIVEFDSWNDLPAFHDINNDHLGIYADGILDATGFIMDGNTLPICLLNDCSNVENGRWYSVAIKWEYISASVQKINVYFSDVLRASSTGNHIANRFNNSNLVFWSIAGATGTSKNLQQFGIESNNNNNLNVCEGSNFTLTAPALATNYSWSNGSTSTTRTATFTAIKNEVITCNYIDYCGNPRTVFFTITVNPNPIVSVNNPSTCEVNPALLIATPAVSALYVYNWTVPSGVTNPGNVASFPVTTSGQYSVAITNSETGCSSTTEKATVVTGSPIEALFSIADTICKDETITALPTISLNGIRGTWQPELNNQRTTTYSFLPDTGQCSPTLTKTITVVEYPVVKLTSNEKICTWESILLNPVTTGTDLQFLWQDGSSDSVLNATQPGIYTVIVTNTCGNDTATALLEITNCGTYIPSAFTPNEDGLNDVFRINGSANTTAFSMRIYNRWGTLLYNSKDPLQGWDGSFNGSKQPPGVYVYQIAFVNPQTGKQIRLRGNFSLLQ